MIYYIVASAFGLLGLSIFILSIYLSKSHRSFEAGRRVGKAEVVGHDYAEGSSWSTPMVRLIGVEHEGMYTCHIGNLRQAEQIPNGTILDVEYAPKRAFGHTYYEVYLLGSRSGSGKDPGKSTMITAVLLFLVAFAFLIAGIIIGT